MTASHFNPFGVPLVEPDQLTLEELLRLLRGDLKGWQYGRCNPYIGRWLATGLERFLLEGGDLAGLLALRPAPGGRTAATTERLHERDAALARLAVTVGSTARARRVLAGVEPCPKKARLLVDALRDRVPKSRAAFCRAVARARRGRDTA
jgi:hypothetical protein